MAEWERQRRAGLGWVDAMIYLRLLFELPPLNDTDTLAPLFFTAPHVRLWSKEGECLTP